MARPRIKRLEPAFFDPNSGRVIRRGRIVPPEDEQAAILAIEGIGWTREATLKNAPPPYTHLIKTHDDEPGSWRWWLAEIDYSHPFPHEFPNAK